jgi:hypothetical protein
MKDQVVAVAERAILKEVVDSLQHSRLLEAVKVWPESARPVRSAEWLAGYQTAIRDVLTIRGAHAEANHELLRGTR